MLDSLGKSISNVVDERLSSPLVSSFVIAWALINYKFFVILVSDASITQTFELIRQICFPDWQAYLLKGLVYPLMAAALYIFALPYPSQFVYEHWRKHLQKTNDIRIRYEDQKLLTIEESRTLRSTSRALQADIDQLHSIIATNETDLKAAAAATREAEKRRVDVENAMMTIKRTAEDFYAQNEALKTDVQELREQLAIASRANMALQAQLDAPRPMQSAVGSMRPNPNQVVIRDDDPPLHPLTPSGALTDATVDALMKTDKKFDGQN